MITWKAPSKRSPWLSFCTGLVLSLSLVASPAFAQNKVEAAAKALQKKAMDDDYLATEFAKGQDKLEKAIASCGTDKCSVAVRASLRRDLGVMQIGGQLDREKGLTNMAEAQKLDPTLGLDPDLRTKDLDAAWAEAKKRAGGGGGTKPPPVATGGQPTGDFVHEPIAEQQIRTPIPIYVEYSGEEQLVKVLARYKGFGMTDWKALELKKTGDKGWSGLVPCADVQQGITQYYLQGFNAAQDPVAVGGDRNNAYKVKVTQDKVADPPHLPGQPPPTQCADSGDCPPNFPGCKKPGGPVSSELVGKDGGEFCEEDTECKSKECKAQKCTEPPHTSDGKFRRVWVGLSVGFDYQFVPSANDVCALNPANGPNPLIPTNGNNYYCVQKSDNSDYPYRPTSAQDATANPRGAENANLVRGQSDKVAGGGAFGNIRILASFDYALNANFLLGLRFGFVALTYPGDAAGQDGKKFPPIHAELRGTYLIGQDAITKSLAPYVMLAAGVATFDSSVKVSVVEQVNGTKAAKDVDAWHIAGPGFFTVGGGVRIGFSERAALLGGLRLNLAVGNDTAFSVGPELGIVFGF